MVDIEIPLGIRNQLSSRDTHVMKRIKIRSRIGLFKIINAVRQEKVLPALDLFSFSFIHIQGNPSRSKSAGIRFYCKKMLFIAFFRCFSLFNPTFIEFLLIAKTNDSDCMVILNA
jgi:hypothetical protein